jgi:uroporphyrinogen decarboxylase
MDLLCSGTTEQVESAVRRAIEAAAPGGGYILSESNSLHPGVNPENCITLFEAAKKYGRYQDPAGQS